MTPRRSLLVGMLLASLAALAAPAAVAEQQQQQQQGLAVYQTRYYVIHTDLDRADVQEAAIRMTRMAEEYHNRTSDFSGVIRERLPFYLYRNPDDYYAGGGVQGSAGVFTGTALLAIAGAHPDARTWHVVQHEGFHQFAAAVIGGDLPTWVNEGLAEYFGEGIFTGDSFVTGIVPAWRLKRVREELKDANGGFHPIPDLMQMSHDQWNREMTILNYDQAWSMVHFLAHGDDGKYQRAFTAFMLGLSRGSPWETAWRDSFGDAVGFEQRWRHYWENLPDNPSEALYARANVATLTSFLARASARRQTFESFAAFLDDADGGKITLPETENEWLPPRLLAAAVTDAKARQQSGAATYALVPQPNRLPQLACTMKDGTRIVGRFAIRRGIAADVVAEVTDRPRAVQAAPLVPPVRTTHRGEGD